jgi:YHS domain-containing protein
MKKKGFRRILGTAIFSTFIVGCFLPGYSYAAEPNNQSILVLESVRQNYLASLRLDSLKTNNNLPGSIKANSSPSQWLKRVKTNEINIVTNRFSKDVQTGISIDGKVYYTSGDSYILNLQENPSIRFARDPFSNKAIDKADAAIYVDASGRAFYFESDESYRNFIALGEQETAFGYTEPK